MSDYADVTTSKPQFSDLIVEPVTLESMKDRPSASVQSQAETGSTAKTDGRPQKRPSKASQDTARKSAADGLSEPPNQEEEAKMRDVASLWSSQRTKTAAVRKTREQLAQVREDLSKGLYELKSVFARNGRGGKWKPYLLSIGISLSTADRYVAKWAASLVPPGKLLTEEVSLSTTDSINALVAKLRPKLMRTLTTPEAISEFMELLAVSLGVANS